MTGIKALALLLVESGTINGPNDMFLPMQNVLHWHIVDSQSFPLEIPSYPKLWDGAYSAEERYTMADAAEIVRQVDVDVIRIDFVICS